ncbi:MAG: NAD(P)H dehydrogenase [Aquabacterium sp.]|jgi:glutathione-regulated potassium-efflux system ancillary protein KefF|nr:MAG: NAD(P)H dehydrogenase [Aquabacterium sp.]
MSGPHVLVLVAHPELRHSRVNRRLLSAARQVAGETANSGEGRVVVQDLYAAYPDFHIDVEREQRLAAAADLIVWQHPVYWYSMPALMKLWLDEVLQRGWAYGPGGGALRGKHLWPVLSTGGPQEAYAPEGYNRFPFDAFLPPYLQTAALCHLQMLPPLVLHGAHALAEDELAGHMQAYAQRLRSYPQWLADLPALPCPDCEVPGEDRPDAPTP